jgi:hypothetical protein
MGRELGMSEEWTRTGRDEPVGIVIYTSMETTQEDSLCSISISNQ